MKLNRLTAIVLVLLFSFPIVLLSQNANAATPHTIFLLEPPHRDLSGKFIDEDLTAALQPTGRLGALVYFPPYRPRTWVIDPALIDDVLALPVDNLVSQAWLSQLKAITNYDNVTAVPYGHPIVSLATRLAPSELLYYSEASQKKLKAFLGNRVQIEVAVTWGASNDTVPAETIRTYTFNRRTLAVLSTVIPAEQLDSLRSSLATLLSSDISKSERLTLTQSADAAVIEQRHKLRIVSGKYRLTSAKEKLPITLVNDYATPITVTLDLQPINSRIQIEKVPPVSLAPKSKTQLSVPITVIASGTTAIVGSFINSHGDGISDSTVLTLNASVISPAVAWFTTGAAILLFLGAITQSVRRVRRART